jgi:hypothetical protein
LQESKSRISDYTKWNNVHTKFHENPFSRPRFIFYAGITGDDVIRRHGGSRMLTSSQSIIHPHYNFKHPSHCYYRLQEIKKYEFGMAFNVTPSIPNLMKVHYLL